MKYLQSRRGFPYSTFSLVMGAVICSLFYVFPVLVPKLVGNSPDVSMVPFVIGAIALLIGFLGAAILSNTQTVRLDGEFILLGEKRNEQRIPIKEIRVISPRLSFMNNSFRYRETFEIEFKQDASYRKKVVFSVDSKSGAEFMRTLKKSWVVSRSNYRK